MWQKELPFEKYTEKTKTNKQKNMACPSSTGSFPQTWILHAQGCHQGGSWRAHWSFCWCWYMVELLPLADHLSTWGFAWASGMNPCDVSTACASWARALNAAPDLCRTTRAREASAALHRQHCWTQRVGHKPLLHHPHLDSHWLSHFPISSILSGGRYWYKWG